MANSIANNQFIQACTDSDLYNIKSLILYSSVDIHFADEAGFNCACYYGNIHVIKYLINLYKNDTIIATPININSDNMLGIKWACENGHLNCVKYIINLYKTHACYGIICLPELYSQHWISWKNKTIRYLHSVGYRCDKIYGIIIFL